MIEQSRMGKWQHLSISFLSELVLHSATVRNLGLSCILSLVMSGCFIVEGSLYRTELAVVLRADNTEYFEKTFEEKLGRSLGRLPQRKGDTLRTVGFFNGGLSNKPAYLMKMGISEVFVLRSDVLTPDDHMYQRLGARFRLGLSDDGNTWGNASSYVKDHSKRELEIENENLIKSGGAVDSVSISYLITRVENYPYAEYEIICRSLKKGFEAEVEARNVAFYMVTGRKYMY